MLWTDRLSEEHRRGLLLLRAYEKECKKIYGGGFRADSITDETCLERPSFKQAVTVAKWLDYEGLPVGAAEINWSGFVAYVFEHFSRLKAVPAVGQLKNPVLLKKYFQHASVSFESVRIRSDDSLEKLYASVIDQDITKDCGMLHLLGLIRSDRS
jgi:hypothetical protein